MSELRPQSLAVLLARALAELEARRSIFDLPRRSFWKGRPGFDLSIESHGSRIATPLGPAAGPHTQLAQNLALAWLAGARALELKTVQVKDRLTIPRPCIDAPNVGFNVEWSQELRLEESLEQYLAAWLMVHALGARTLGESVSGLSDTQFICSVGYDLEGIRSEPVARFLDGLTDARPRLLALRDGLPRTLRACVPDEFPERPCATVTLSTFHGCPADEIERIGEHLLARHGLNVVLKLNPTLLGYEETDALLRGALGYEELALDRRSFETDLRFEEALGICDRLGRAAETRGLGLGVKLTNTLVVKNTKRTLEGELVYLSGAPLHPIAIHLADRFARALAGRIPLSLSAGVVAENFADAVACGFAPVTTCTDLLKPTGYRRLPRYLKALESEMERLSATTIPSYILARARCGSGTADGGTSAAGTEIARATPAAADGPGAVRAAALSNLATYAARVAYVSRYHAAANRGTPRREPSRLRLFDCVSCNNCLLVCPNDAFFSLPLGRQTIDTWDLVVRGGHVEAIPARFALERDEQWACYADFCNACGNCDTFCPEEDGPFRMKPRFCGSIASFEAEAPEDALLIETPEGVMCARFGAVVYRMSSESGTCRFTDGIIEAELDREHRVVHTRVVTPRDGHVLPLARYHAMRLLRDAALRGVNPVSAPWLPALRDATGQIDCRTAHFK